jgi:ADP-ribose pyrophosphatase YjhB (NUDIX family)
MKLSYVAGGVVVGEDGNVVVVSQNGDSWSLPKGHIDEGESAQVAAMREIAEESGVTDLELVKELGTYKRYRIGRGGKGNDVTEEKVISMFLFKTGQHQLAPTDPRHPEARWVNPERVADLLTHPKDKEFFQGVLPELMGWEA